jgi:aspartyl-tRNA(Asn)/glutamyl-tRNA(Gln) amidotransferase subunit A
MIKSGMNISLKEYFSAVMARGELSGRMKKFHEKFELLLTPTVARPPFSLGHGTPSDLDSDEWFIRDGINWTPFGYPFNLTGQPAASIPCGLTKKGLPVGLQIVGPLYGDDVVLKASWAYEAVRGEFPLPPI